jgi:hypothetical protein
MASRRSRSSSSWPGDKVPVAVQGKRVRVGVLDRPQVLGQLRDHRAGQGHHAPAGPGLGRPMTEAAVSLAGNLTDLTRAQLIALLHDLANQLAAADQHDDRLLRAYTDLYDRRNGYGSA